MICEPWAGGRASRRRVDGPTGVAADGQGRILHTHAPPSMPDRMKPTTVLIDLAGVLHIGEHAVPGAVDALARLRSGVHAVRFVTNTTRKPREVLADDLRALGFDLQTDEIVSAASAALDLVRQRGLKPHLLIHPNLASDFAGLQADEPDCVLLGDAEHGFTYEAMDACFRVLMGDASRPLIAMAANRFFTDAAGPHIDMGAFVAALEYATGRRAEITGKPAPAFFEAALASAQATADRAVMIGDDVEADVEGAIAAGLRGMLVRTGKFREADAARATAAGATVVDDFAAAVDALLAGG